MSRRFVSVLALALSVSMIAGCGVSRLEERREGAAGSPAASTPTAASASDETVKHVALAASAEIVPVPVQPAANVKLGRGYNSLTGAITNDCIEGGREEPVAGVEGQRTYWRMKEITKSDELSRFWSMGASASFGAGPYSGSLQMNAFQSSQYSLMQSLFVLDMTVENATTMLGGSYRLNEDGEAELAKGPENFFEKCGDSFIVTTVTGGRFSATAAMRTETRSEQARVDASASGSAGTASGSVTFSQEFRSVFNEKNKGVSIFRDGTQDSIPQQTAEALLDYATHFPTRIGGPNASKARLILVSVAPYSVAFGVPLSRLPHLARAKATVAELARRKNRIRDLRAQLQYVVDNGYQFAAFDRVVLKDAIGDYEALEENIDKAASTCLAKPLSCPEPGQALAVHAVAIPERVLDHRLYEGVGASNRGIVTTAQVLRGEQARFIGFSLYQAGQNTVALWKGSTVPPCQESIVYPTPEANCKTQIGYMSTTQDENSTLRVYSGTRPNIDYTFLVTYPTAVPSGFLRTPR